MSLAEMIEVREGKIEEFVEKYNIDAIVNPARPSLMGGKRDGSVDEAIHQKINRLERKNGYFKEFIKDEFEEKVNTRKADVIRCERGEAVLTEGGKLCKYVINLK